MTEVSREINTYIEWNENKNTKYQTFWDASKAVLRRKFIALHTDIMKEEMFKIINLNSHYTHTHAHTKKERKLEKGE